MKKALARLFYFLVENMRILFQNNIPQEKTSYNIFFRLKLVDAHRVGREKNIATVLDHIFSSPLEELKIHKIYDIHVNS